MNEINPGENYTSPLLPNEWETIKPLIDKLTRQRDRLAKHVRSHEAGEAVEVQEAINVLAETREAITKALPLTVSPTTPIDQSTRELLANYWQQVKTRRNAASTGIAGLNDVLSGGIEPQRLVGLLGAPNCGKTALAQQLADHMACSGRPVLYVTSEDSPSTLLAKTLARIGNVNYTAVLKGWESEETKINAALAQQMDRLSTDRLRYLDATNGVMLDAIRDKAEEHFKRFDTAHGGGPGILIVDYLQRIARIIKTLGGMSQDLREVVTLVAERLRGMAYELDCGVIAIASQNRAGYGRSNDIGIWQGLLPGTAI